MPVTIMAKNYSHCPLKKRPVQYTEEFSSVSDEPENLSTKPEDLSLSSRHTSNKSPALSIISSSPPGSPAVSMSPSPPPSSVTSTASPPPMPMPAIIMRSPSPTLAMDHQHHHRSYHHHLYAPTAIKMEPSYIKPELEYAPQTWARSIYPPNAGGYHHHHIPLHYPHPYEYLGVNSPPASSTSSYNSDSSCSPPHSQFNPINHHVRQPLQPLALRPSSIYSSLDSNSLSPNSSTTTSPPPQAVILGNAEDLTHAIPDKKGGGAGVRHKCPDCGKSYSTFSGLSKHRQFHCAAGDGPRKSFSCKYCEKVYVSLGALKMHIRTHTLPCKCTICGKAFSRPWLLQGHIRTHTGEKPFSCTYCHRAFADRSNLRAHLQTHSDVKKYSCPSCGKMFSRMSLLTKHAESGCGACSVPGSPVDSMVH